MLPRRGVTVTLLTLMSRASRKFVSPAFNGLHLAFCLCVALVLLILPMPHGHQPIQKIRAPEISHSLTSSVSLERSTSDISDRLVLNCLRPVQSFVPATQDRVEPREVFDPAPRDSLIRLLLRFKLGPSASSLSDPLL